MRRIIAHKLKWDDEGVASTVGTIMALLIFLTFLSMIINHYVPVWMKDTESSHMNVAYGQFGNLKQNIDIQALFASMSELTGERYVPTVIFNPITLGVDGVPIFSAPTIGDLNADQDLNPWNVWFEYYPSKFSNINHIVNETAKGAINLEVRNRYFVPQTLVYENGAVIRVQNDGMILRAEPGFEVRIINNTEEITMVLVSLLGSGGMQGTTTEGVHTKVVSASTDDYKRVFTDVYINHTSPYGLAWYAFYNKTLNDAFDIPSDAYGDCSPGSEYCYTMQSGGPYGILSQMIRSPYFKIFVQLNQSSGNFHMILQLKNDYNNQIQETMPIATLRIQKIIVNMAVGGLGSQIDI